MAIAGVLGDPFLEKVGFLFALLALGELKTFPDLGETNFATALPAGFALPARPSFISEPDPFSLKHEGQQPSALTDNKKPASNKQKGFISPMAMALKYICLGVLSANRRAPPALSGWTQPSLGGGFPS